MGWASLPVCLPCWRLTNGDREPVRMKGWPEERCTHCGRRTNHGIYVRLERPRTMGEAAQKWPG